MPLYCTVDDVKLRLQSKVRFTDDEADQNKMSMRLLTRLIDEAEGQVEQDLSPRYFLPLQTTDGVSMAKVPSGTSKQIIKTMAELMAVIRVLETDFGRGSAIDGDAYIVKLQDRYDKILTGKILAKKEEHSNQWMFPPLPNLRLAIFNTEADDGYQGMVLTTSSGIGDYAAKQVNSPGESWWTGLFEDNF